MLKKKLLAIAGVLGILACGACFLPPVHNGPPTPPPLPPQLQGIHTVRVVVTDNSIPARIDTQSIAASVADFINRTRSDQGISAHASKEPADADLEIAIAAENAALIQPQSSHGTESWSFSLTVTAALVRNGKTLVGPKPNMPIRIQLELPPQHPADVWSIPEVLRACTNQLVVAVTLRVFS